MTTKFQNKFIFVFFLVFFEFVVSEKFEIKIQENQENIQATAAPPANDTKNSNLLKYHGGPILTQPISLHYFWYGSWGKNDQEVEIATFVGNNIATSDWYRVTVCYTDKSGHTITDSIDVASSSFMNEKTFGKNIDQTQFSQIIQQGIADNNVGEDPNDIYVLWLHEDVNAESLCSDTCGYHWNYNVSQGTIKYFVVGSGGNAMTCDGCISPNGPWHPRTNQIINSFAHQLIETVSDPVPWTGYYDPMNRENGDKCAGNFISSTPFNPDPSKSWNVVIGIETPHWFLLQGNWDIVTQNCTLVPSDNCYLHGGVKPLTSNIHMPSGSSSGMMIHVGVYHFLVILLVCVVNILLF